MATPSTESGRGPSAESIEQMLLLNEEQATFYDNIEKPGNLVTRLWHFARRRIERTRRLLQQDTYLSDLHRKWLGNLEAKSVLDLGASSGNPLSLEIARASRQYLAIDLSAAAIGQLQARLESEGLSHASARVVDFLAPDFDEKFDVVYAKSVMHHFRYFEDFLQILREKLNPGGFVVSYDPLQTDWVGRGLRAAYRPFQSDKEWEWPFTRHSLETIQRYFTVANIAGFSGKVKWVFPLAVLSPELAAKVGRPLLASDKAQAVAIGPELYRCWQVAMKLEPKADVFAGVDEATKA